MIELGQYLKQKRLEMQSLDSKYSLRQTAVRLGIQPSYLSRLERGQESSVSEELLQKLSADLALDPDVTLALAGKVSIKLQKIILKNPTSFASLIRTLENAPADAILRITREVKDGIW